MAIQIHFLMQRQFFPNLLLSIILVLLCSMTVTAQGAKPTPEQIKQALEAAKKLKARGLKGDDPEAMAEEAKKILKPMMKTVMSIPRQTTAIKTVQKIVLTPIQRKKLKGEELKKYIQRLNTDLFTKMSSNSRKLVQDILSDTKVSLNLFDLGMSAYLNGALQEGAFLAGTALIGDIGDDLNINSYTAMLINANAPAEAMPICKGLVSRYPEHALILNNLAQAFMGIGEQDSAMVYLRKCLKQQPGHPQANNSAAQIFKQQGQKEKALEFAKKSVEAGLNDGAMEIIDELDKSRTAYDFFAKPKDLPDYFDLYKIKKPMHQKRVEDEQLVKGERAAFRTEIDRMRGVLSEIISREQELGNKQLNNRIQNLQKRLSAGEQITVNVGNPWFEKAAKIFTNKYIQQDVLLAMRKEEEAFNRRINDLEKDYDINETKIYQDHAQKKAQYKCDGEGSSSGCVNIERLTKEECKAINGLRDRFLVACATAAEAYDEKQLHWAAERFFFQSKWGYLVGANEHLANVNYYKYADEYLKNISKIMTNYRSKGPACSSLEQQFKTMSFADIMAPRCPVNLTVELGLLNIKANCKETTTTIKGPAETWAGKWRLQQKENYALGQSTFAVIYVIKEVKKELVKPLENAIRIKAGVKAELTVQGFITSSKNNTWDGGGKLMASASGWAFDTISGVGENIEGSGEVSWSYQAGWNGAAKGLNGIFSTSSQSLPDY